MTEIPVQRSCAELNMKLSYSVFRAFRDEWILLRGLRTREATDAVHLLEVLDVAWKDGRGQCSAVQGHKLRLAMRLADAGFLQKAYQYVVNTQAEVRQETARFLFRSRSAGSRYFCLSYVTGASCLLCLPLG